MYTLEDRIGAGVELLKRYSVFRMSNIAEYKHKGEVNFYNKTLNLSKKEQRDLLEECIEVACMSEIDKDRKRAARVMMELICGKQNANNMLEGRAVVTNRGDALVRRWRNKVIDRDMFCQNCGDNKNLHAHHISRWIDDPVNRINVENGITLCADCHVKLHEEHRKLILSRVER